MGKTYLQGDVLTATDLNASFAEAVNTTGFFVFTGSHVYNSSLTANNGFTVNTTPSYFLSQANFYSNVVISTGNVVVSTGNINVSTGNISDKIGNVRKVPDNYITTPYTLQASDSGKVVRTVNQPITIPINVFTNGDTINILNWSGTPTTIVAAAGLTMYWAGQVLSGSRTIGWIGLCTVLFVSPTECVISGAGLT